MARHLRERALEAQARPHQVIEMSHEEELTRHRKRYYKDKPARRRREREKEKCRERKRRLEELHKEVSCMI